MRPSTIGRGAGLGGRSQIGDGNRFGDGVTFGSGLVIGHENKFGPEIQMDDDTRIGNGDTFAGGERARFRPGGHWGDDNVVGPGHATGAVQVGSRNVLGANVALGDGATVGNDAQIGNGVSLFGDASVTDGEIVGIKPKRESLAPACCDRRRRLEAHRYPTQVSPDLPHRFPADCPLLGSLVATRV